MEISVYLTVEWEDLGRTANVACVSVIIDFKTHSIFIYEKARFADKHRK